MTFGSFGCIIYIEVKENTSNLKTKGFDYMFENMDFFETAKAISKEFDIDVVMQFTHGYVFSMTVKEAYTVEDAEKIFSLVDYLTINCKRIYISGSVTGYVLHDDVIFFINEDLLQDAKAIIELFG